MVNSNTSNNNKTFYKIKSLTNSKIFNNTNLVISNIFKNNKSIDNKISIFNSNAINNSSADINVLYSSLTLDSFFGFNNNTNNLLNLLITPSGKLFCIKKKL